MQKRGLTFAQISDLLNETEKRGLIEFSEDQKTKLTNLGRAFLAQSAKSSNMGALWIEPMGEMECDKESYMSIYIPSRKVIKKLP